MANWFKKTIDLGGYATTVWSFVPAAFQTTITTALTVVTGYFGYQELGIARAIFLATGVMAFGLASVFLWFRLGQIIGTFQRLSAAGLVIPSASIDAPNGKVNGINVQLILRNDSFMIMFYRIKRTHSSFERIGPADTSVDRSVVPISPGNTALINFATIENVPFENKKVRRIRGTYELEVEYGSEIDSLKFLFRYKTDIFVVFTPDSNQTRNQKFRYDCGSAVKTYEHERI